MAQAPQAPGDAPPSKRFKLDAEHELRFEIPPDVATATVTLEEGAAELFGIELARNRAYALPSSFNAAVFTWHGATLTLQAPDSVMAYTATDTPMPQYVCAHAVLQSKRRIAKAAGLPGPRAVVVGSRDCGKTALVTLLAAYCLKENGRAHVVDGDPSGCGAIGVVPGSVAFSAVRHLDLDVGGLVHDKLLALMVGHMSPRHNPRVSQAVLAALGELVDEVLSTAALAPYIGCVADTCGDVDGKDGAESAVEAVKALKADVVFVLGSERLYASIRSTFEHSATESVLLTKSGGVVSRNEEWRMALRSTKVRQYFYGVDNTFSPFSSVIDFDAVVVLKVGGMVSVVPDSVLPVGAESSLDPLKPMRVSSLGELLHKLVAVSQAEEEEAVLRTAVYGFVHVVKVDGDRNTLTVLSPSPGKVPGRLLLVGDTTWIE